MESSREAIVMMARERSDDELRRVDRSAFEVVPLFDEPDDRAFWLSRPASERWRAMELLRQVAYGHARTSARLQRVLEIVEIEWG
jgi:hypothetical protein